MLFLRLTVGLALYTGVEVHGSYVGEALEGMQIFILAEGLKIEFYIIR